ncbi:MAG: hypothetical protein SGCHY_003712 [Lobulomycetales sp.]
MYTVFQRYTPAPPLLTCTRQDATCRVWDISTSPASPSRILECWNGHLGKNVWSLAIHAYSGVIATGGADAGVRLWWLADTTVHTTALASASTVKSFSLLDACGDEFVTVSDSGVVELHSSGDRDGSGTTLADSHLDQDGSVTLLAEFPLLADFSCTSSIPLAEPDGHLVACASISGDLILLGTRRTIQPACFDASVLENGGKIHKIFLARRGSNVILAMHSLLRNTLTLFTVTLAAPNAPGLLRKVCLDPVNSMHTPLSAVITAMHVLDPADALMLGTRTGSVLVYDLTTSALVAEFAHVHGTEAVTDFHMEAFYHHQQQQRSPDSVPVHAPVSLATILTTGRDGCLCRHTLRLSHTSAARIAALTTQTRVPICRWLEKIITQPGRTIICGFHKKAFHVYKLAAGPLAVTLLHAIPGVGSNSQWAASFTRRSRFACVRGGRVHVYRFAAPTYTPDVCPAFAGLETRCTRVVAADGGVFVVAAGEDAVLRLFRGSVARDALFCLLSCSRAQASVVLGCTRVRSGGVFFTCGARSSLAAWRMEDRIECGFVELCVAERADGSDCIRYVDVAATPVHGVDGSFLVVVGRSDGMLGLFEYTAAGNSFRQLGVQSRGDGAQRCLLKVRILPIGGGVYVLVAGYSDGKVVCSRLAFADGKLACDPKISFSSHQSGINGMDVFLDSANETLDSGNVERKELWILSGGDDASICIQVLCIYDQKWSIKSRALVRNAHSSSVTGACWSGRGKAVSCSVDQSVCVWNIDMDDTEPIRLASRRYTSVPDVSDMSLVTLGGQASTDVPVVSICGVGAQLLVLSDGLD